MASVDRRTSHVSLHAGIVDNFVNAISSHARLHLSRSNVDHFSSHPTNFPHGILLLGIEDCDLVPANKNLLGSGHAIFGIVGVGYSFGYCSSRRERIHRPQRASIRVCRERIVLAGRFINVRHNLWREEVVEQITLRLMGGLVGALTYKQIRELSFQLDGCDLTQFFLKQS